MSKPVSRSAFPTRFLTVSGVCSVRGTACLSYQERVFVSRLSFRPFAVSQPLCDRFGPFPKALRYHSTVSKQRSSLFDKIIRSFSRIVDRTGSPPHHLVGSRCLACANTSRPTGFRGCANPIQAILQPNAGLSNGPRNAHGDQKVSVIGDPSRRWQPFLPEAARETLLPSPKQSFPRWTRHLSGFVLPEGCIAGVTSEGFAQSLPPPAPTCLLFRCERPR